MKIYEPNYTQVPNAVISLMPELKESELKVLLAIVRKTIGWQKKRDRISLSQLQELTGLGRASVSEAIQSEKLKGVVRVHKTKQGNEYEMVIHSMESEPLEEEVVQNMNQGSMNSEPVGSMNSEHTIDTITKETIQNKDYSFFEKVNNSNSAKELSKLWYSYRKKKGKHPNLYEQEVLMHEWKSKSLSEIKQAILHTVKNGWISLQYIETDNGLDNNLRRKRNV